MYEDMVHTLYTWPMGGQALPMSVQTLPIVGQISKTKIVDLTSAVKERRNSTFDKWFQFQLAYEKVITWWCRTRNFL